MSKAKFKTVLEDANLASSFISFLSLHTARLATSQTERLANKNIEELKDGTSFCYCAYVLRMTEYSEKLGFSSYGRRLLIQGYFCVVYN